MQKTTGLLSLTSVAQKAELSRFWCSNRDISLPLLNFSPDDAHLKPLCMLVSSYDFSRSNKKKRWIKIFKHVGHRLKIVFSLHRVTRRLKRELQKIVSPLEKEILTLIIIMKEKFSLMLGIKKIGRWWKQVPLVPIYR